MNDDDDDRLPTVGPDHARWPGGVRFALPRRGVARAVRAIRYVSSVGLRARPSSTTWTTIYSIRSDASENRPCMLYYYCHIFRVPLQVLCRSNKPWCVARINRVCVVVSRLSCFPWTDMVSYTLPTTDYYCIHHNIIIIK